MTVSLIIAITFAGVSSSASSSPLPNLTNDASSTTVTIYSQAEDGELLRINCSDWNACRNASSSTYAWSIYPWGTVESGFYNSSYHVKRIFFFFDTSTIPTNAHIDSVVLNVYAGQYQSGNTTVHVVRSTANIPLSTAEFTHFQYLSGGSSTPSPNSWMSIA